MRQDDMPNRYSFVKALKTKLMCKMDGTRNHDSRIAKKWSTNDSKIARKTVIGMYGHRTKNLEIMGIFQAEFHGIGKCTHISIERKSVGQKLSLRPMVKQPS